MEILKVLNNLKINYELMDHKPVFTSDEAQFIKENLKGLGVKNLFLKDNNNNYYILLLPDNKKADLKRLQTILNLSHIKFASEEELKEILNLTRGSVTPLGIINDKENLVTLLINKELINEYLLVHPNTNTKTIKIEYNDLIKFIEYTRHKYIIIDN